MTLSINEDLGDVYTKQLSNKSLKGIAKAIEDHKKEVLKLHKLPMSTDCLLEIVNAEKSFRINIINDLTKAIETACNICPMGFTQDSCQAKQCPYKTLKDILEENINRLEQTLPGGL